MAELREVVQRVIEVHDRSELVEAIRAAARSGGRVEVDWRLQLHRHDITHAAMKAGLFSPRAGYIGPEFRQDVRGGAVRAIQYDASVYHH